MVDPSAVTKWVFKEITESTKAIFALTLRLFPFYMTNIFLWNRAVKINYLAHIRRIYVFPLSEPVLLAKYIFIST